MTLAREPVTDASAREARTVELQRDSLYRLNVHTDHLFLVLMVVQWVGGIIVALAVSPRTWIGMTSYWHTHVWAAILLGAVLSSLPIALILLRPGAKLTAYVVAVAQILWSALLIHVTGGRIETHFHVFCSLALLAFYRQPGVLLAATAVAALDHLVRGVLWPQSVFGIFIESPWRWLEHTAWIGFEDVVLMMAMRHSLVELRTSCAWQADLEARNRDFESQVLSRTQELDAAHRFLRLVIDAIDANICILDREGRIVSTNAKWNAFRDANGGDCTKTGCGVAYLSCLRRTAGDVPAKEITTGIGEVLNGKRDTYTYTYSCHSPRQQRWFEMRASRLMSEQGGVVIAHWDITQRVLAELSLQEKTAEAELLALVAKHTDNGVVITNRSANIEWVNDGFTRITGHRLEDVKGRKPGDFMQGPETDPWAVECMQAAIRDGNGFDLELRNYRKDGTPFDLSVECRPICDADGRVVRFIGIQTDITERKRAQAEREALQREIADLARRSGMAEVATSVLHNVGNVLTSINISAEHLKQQLRHGPLESLSRVSDRITDSADMFQNTLGQDDRLDMLTRYLEKLATAWSSQREELLGELNLLGNNLEHIKDVIRVQQDYAKGASALEELCFAQLISDAAVTIRQGAAEALIQFEAVVDDTPRIVADRHKVLQILINLLSNAKHAVMSADRMDRRIRVRVSPCAEGACLDVTDNGTGFTADASSKIFQLGYTTKKQGHGFGLHSSALLATEMGGRLTASSPGPHQGATFRLVIPQSPKRPKEHTCQSQQLAVNAY